MTDWRLAKSLVNFRDECDRVWPNRSRLHDGTIGDVRHQHESSGHNPDVNDVVVAFDLTHSPLTGPDCTVVFDQLIRCKHPALTEGYAIWNHHIWFPDRGITIYRGSDPHTDHLHLSVGHDTYPFKGSHGHSRFYDDNEPWNLEVFSDMPTAAEIVNAFLDADLGDIDDDGVVKKYTVRDGLRTLLHQAFAIRSQTQQLLTKK